MNTLLIRLDANREIGLGHLGRCLSLTAPLRAAGAKPIFALSGASSPEAVQRLCDAGETVELLPTHIAGGVDDAGTTMLAMQRLGAHTVLLDGYQFRKQMLALLRVDCERIAFIDDVEEASLDVDVFINPSLHGDTCKVTLPPNGQALLGARYALIRRSFLVARQQKRDIAKPDGILKLLVSMGGTDPTHKTLGVLQALAGLSAPAKGNIEAKVLLATNAPHFAEAHRQANRSSFPLIITGTVPDLAPVLVETDLAVVSASTTLAELATVGVPAVTMAVVDNQVPVAKAASRMQLAQVVDGEVEQIRHAIEALIGDPDGRQTMALRQRNFVDGLGAQRVASVLASPKSGTLEAP